MPSIDISVAELSLFGDIVAKLEEMGPTVDIRRFVLADVTRMLQSDFCCAFVWDSEAKAYVDPIAVNLDADHLRRYQLWYQFNDPITGLLENRRKATTVGEVIGREDFENTEFYKDFLAPDGLHDGMNLYVFDGARHLCDFRIWRSKGRPEFTSRETMMLDALEPFIRRAVLRRRARTVGLTTREDEIAQLVARGCTDQDIGRLLSVSVSTVRTHLRHIMEKKSLSNRAELAACIAAQGAESGRSLAAN